MVSIMEQKVIDRLAEVKKERKESPRPYENIPWPRQPPWWLDKMKWLAHQELTLLRLLDHRK